MGRLTLQCWRCKAEAIHRKLEVARDPDKILPDVKLTLYSCGNCDTKWYAAENVAPTLMWMRQQLRQLRRPATEGTRVERPP